MNTTKNMQEWAKRGVVFLEDPRYTPEQIATYDFNKMVASHWHGRQPQPKLNREQRRKMKG